MAPRSLLARAVFAVALLAGSTAACNGGSKDTAGCGKPFAEPIDPASSQHVLPGAPEPTYRTDPPTSGAHRPGEVPSGVVRTPLDRPAQVNALEAGKVLVQYRRLNPAGFAAVRRLGSDQVIVAPNRSLKTAVVATAWLFKLECTRVDATALRAFISAHADKHASDS